MPRAMLRPLAYRHLCRAPRAALSIRLLLAVLRVALLIAAVLLISHSRGLRAAELSFEVEEVERSLNIGYAVTLADVDGDGRLDIVVVDTNRVIWYENPHWRPWVLTQSQTQEDNVAIAAHDIDGDGQIDFALAAAWRPPGTTAGGSLQWLARDGDPRQPWTIHPIGSEPTAHRIRWADLEGHGRPQLVVVPLHGRGTTAPGWDQRPLRVLAYRVPEPPTSSPWSYEVLNEELHVAHNFWPGDLDGDGQLDLLVASFEGVTLLRRDAAGAWRAKRLGEGDQQSRPNRGASEVKSGRLASGRDYIATIEPWHGNQVVAYTRPRAGTAEADDRGLWRRQVLDDQLRWGHAVWCADLDGDGDEELIVGVRDEHADGARCGLRIYDPQGGIGRRWERHLIDPGGVAIEDLAVGDLDGDGQPDVVAVGRQTHNVRIYWNRSR